MRERQISRQNEQVSIWIEEEDSKLLALLIWLYSYTFLGPVENTININYVASHYNDIYSIINASQLLGLSFQSSEL